jgi:ATP-dependent helicase YprA (DUF1998 family)
VDVAKRVTFRIRGGMPMADRSNARRRRFTNEKNVAAAGDYFTSRTVFNKYATLCMFPKSKLQVRTPFLKAHRSLKRSGGAKAVVDLGLSRLGGLRWG